MLNKTEKSAFITPSTGWSDQIENASTEVFEIMVGAPLVPRRESGDPPAGDLTAMVGLAGSLCGILSVRCYREVGRRVASHMLAIPEPTDGQVRDALGEICNIVAGNLKAKITGLADTCLLSVPTVITGEDYELHPLDENGHYLIAMEFEGLPLWIALSLQN